MKGLVLLGRAGRGSVTKAFGEERSISCDLLRDGTGGGGSKEEANGDGVESEEEEEDSKAWRSNRAEDWWEKEDGSVVEENTDGGTEGGAWREEPLLSDWVLCQEGAEWKSNASLSKGLGLHCASLWIPFNPFVYKDTKRNVTLTAESEEI